MEEQFNRYMESYKSAVRQTFRDFLNHELISKDPLSLSEDEIWSGIRERSDNRGWHRCDMIERMNRYCTLVTLVGTKNIETGYNIAPHGIFRYSYNTAKEFMIIHSCFKYKHSFCDFGTAIEFFGGNNNDVYTTLDLINNGRRFIQRFPSDIIFEESTNWGKDIFLEYDIEGESKFNSIHHLPSFANIGEDNSYFIPEVRKSLLKTKYFLLSLVNKYPRHLFHNPDRFLKSASSFPEIFDFLYDQEMKEKVASLLETAKQELQKHNVIIHLPF